MLRTLLVAGLVLGATWGLLVVAAKRLPPGILKDLAGFLPACLTTMHRLRNNPQVPARAKLAVRVAGLWLLSPIDLLPEFLPVIGPLDDVLVVALALRYAARSVPARSCWTPGRPTPGCWSASSAHPPVSPRPGPGSRSGPCSRCWCPPPGPCATTTSQLDGCGGLRGHGAGCGGSRHRLWQISGKANASDGRPSLPGPTLPITLAHAWTARDFGSFGPSTRVRSDSRTS
jgi:uncharacterized membrane protein YkvA (DUF1232 family)